MSALAWDPAPDRRPASCRRRRAPSRRWPRRPAREICSSAPTAAGLALQQPAVLRHAVKRYETVPSGCGRRRRVLARCADASPRPSPSPRRSRGATAGAASIQVPDTPMVLHLHTDEGRSSRRTRRAGAPGPSAPARPPRGACRPPCSCTSCTARRESHAARPRRLRMVFTHGETNTRTRQRLVAEGDPPAALTPRTSIHSPPPRPPARQEASDELELAHFRVPPRRRAASRHPARFREAARLEYTRARPSTAPCRPLSRGTRRRPHARRRRPGGGQLRRRKSSTRRSRSQPFVHAARRIR